MIVTWLAFLRGVNLGGHHKLPMKDLAALFTAAGASAVQTFIQSGNVVFRAPEKKAAKIALGVEAAILEQFGFGAPIVLRSASQLAELVDGNPFLRNGHSEDHQHVMLLSGAPEAERTGTLDSERFLPDAFEVIGPNIYLHLPNGMGRSKLTNIYFDKKLGLIGTARNWRTVKSLLAMAKD